MNNSTKGKFVVWLSEIPYTLTEIIDDFTEPKKGDSESVNNMFPFAEGRKGPSRFRETGLMNKLPTSILIG
jgi:hypothetical protein